MIETKGVSEFKVGISVVIPTYNRKKLLGETLKSLSNQTLAKDLFEVIVVDDGSSDGSQDVVEDFKSKLNIKYFFQANEGFRVAKARNVGIQHAIFSVTVFLDSGVIISSNCLENHLLQHNLRNNNAVIALSYGINEYDARHTEELEKLIQANDINDALYKLRLLPHLQDCRTDFLKAIRYNLKNIQNPWILFWTSHVSASTKALHEVGGFDEAFNSWGGEDVELALRLYLQGCSFEILSDVQSIHYPHTRDAEKNRSDSKHNVMYIHKKHQLESTRLLTYMNWEDQLKLDLK